MNELSSKRRLVGMAAPGSAWLFAVCLVLGGCSSKSDEGGQAGASGASAAGAGNSSAGNGTSGGGAVSTGGASGGPSSGGSSGTLSQAGQAGSAAGAGAGQAGTGPISNVLIVPHPVALSAGKAFNIAEDFFDDGFIPPSPLANFGFQTPIIPV